MPQVDLETIVSVCGGSGGENRKIACETLIDSNRPSEDAGLSEAASDFPPESFLLSKDAEFDWFDRNAFYERKDSGKGNAYSGNLNPNSNSQRFGLNVKSKASIIGLPKPQKSRFTEAKLRRPADIRFFPKRQQSTGKSGVPMSEPSSPKVSCMGRVRSNREKKRRMRNVKKSNESATMMTKSVRRSRRGFWTSVGAIFRHGRRQRKQQSVELESEPMTANSESVQTKNSIKMAADPPCLGGMNRFASGRRSDSWPVVETAEKEAAKSQPLDLHSLWSRRDGAPPPEEVDCDRELGTVGPASV